MLSRVLLRFIEGKEITTGHDKKNRESFAFTV